MSNFKCQINSKNKKFQSIGYLILVVFVALVVFPKQVFAENIALGIYPPLIQIQAVAPSDIQSPMTVSNESDTAVTVHIVVRPFTQANTNNGEPLYFSSGQHFGEDAQIFQKMAIFDGTQNTDHLILAPNQKKNIELRIHLPSGEPPSDYYFSITMLSNAIQTDHVSGTKVSGGVSTNVLLSIGPKDKTTGAVKDFSAPFFVSHGPVPFTVLITNTSHHFFSPQGTILIRNMFGQIIGKVNLRQDNILAGTSRYLIDDAIRSSIVNHPIAFWNEKFLLGPYSATLTTALSAEGPVYRETIYFFALPIQVLIGTMLGIILVAVVVYRVKKRLQ